MSDEYYDYCRWRFVQRIASSALSVLATQQMLFAVGLGAKRALPTAAALNWVLKDGLGRLGPRARSLLPAPARALVFVVARRCRWRSWLQREGRG